jgi:hypothetical protein
MKSQIHEHQKKSIVAVSKSKLTILLAAGIFFAVTTQAQGRPGYDRDIRHDRVEVRHDRQDLRHDRRDLRFDRRDRCYR